MRNIKKYEDFLNEEVNLKKALTTGALAAGMMLSNPVYSQTKTNTTKTEETSKKDNLYYISTSSKSGLNGPYNKDPVKNIKFAVTPYVVDTLGLSLVELEKIYLKALETAKIKLLLSSSLKDKKTFDYKSNENGIIGGIVSIEELRRQGPEFSSDKDLYISFSFTCDGNEYVVGIECYLSAAKSGNIPYNAIGVTKVCCGPWEPFE